MTHTRGDWRLVYLGGEHKRPWACQEYAARPLRWVTRGFYASPRGAANRILSNYLRLPYDIRDAAAEIEQQVRAAEARITVLCQDIHQEN